MKFIGYLESYAKNRLEILTNFTRNEYNQTV